MIKPIRRRLIRWGCEAPQIAAAGMDVGGVEYLVTARDGEPYFYDVNALSNFVADALNLIGFNPYVNLVDLIVERSGRSAPRVSAA